MDEVLKMDKERNICKKCGESRAIQDWGVCPDCFRQECKDSWE